MGTFSIKATIEVTSGNIVWGYYSQSAACSQTEFIDFGVIGNCFFVGYACLI